MTGADNQQERPCIEAISSSLGSFLSGFALRQGSFMLVCRRRDQDARRFRISAAFNVSQRDRAPLDLFRETLECGTLMTGGKRRLVLGGQSTLGYHLPDRAVLRSVPDRGTEGGGLSALEKCSCASRCRPPQRPGLRQGSSSPGTDEPPRKEALSDARNPQRLYAEPTGLERLWDEIVRSHGRP